MKVDTVRCYDRPLSSLEVLKNYVYNIRDEIQQNELYSKNNLNDSNDDVIPEEIPYMTFYITRDDWEKMTKTEKKNITIEYHDPNPPEGNQQDYRWEKVKTCWQGTSSMAYPVKNFKIKLPSKYCIRGEKKSFPEKTFCLKADYMDSSHCHNTGNANFIHETGLLTNYSLTPPQSKELNVSVKDGYKGLSNLPSIDLDGEAIDESKKNPDNLKTRTCVYGHPIALYIAIKEDGEEDYNAPIFWGIYNFNLDKGALSSFGLERKDKDT
jgi:hypothetical protein